MFLLARHWRQPRLVIAFFLLEFLFTIPALVLYALADPDEYRTKLWNDGAMNGFNSSPKAGLYEAANYRPVVVPMVWSGFITRYNVVASVLITFLMLVKAIMFILHIWVPILSFFVHLACTALFAYSVKVQAMSDLSDPEHPQHGAPWYITKSCKVAYYEMDVVYCQQAKSAFAITIILVIIFGINTLWALYSSIPTKAEIEERKRWKEEQAEVDVLEKWNPEVDEEVYEMHGMKSPAFSQFRVGRAVTSKGLHGGNVDMVDEEPLPGGIAPMQRGPFSPSPPTAPLSGGMPPAKTEEGAASPRTFAFSRLTGRK